MTRTPLKLRVTEPRQQENPAYRAALWVSLAWALGFAAFALLFHAKDGPFHIGAYGYALLAMIAGAPLGLIWAAAFALSQARLLIAETARSREMAAGLAGPAAVAAAQAGEVMDGLASRIAAATAAASQAAERLSALRSLLAEETARLGEAAAAAETNSGRFVERLSSQRADLTTLAVTLDARAAAVTDAINRQTRMVVEASDLAERQLREAEASLSARTAGLAGAAATALEASRTASDDLARQIARMEMAGVGVGDQLHALESGLTEQRAGLVTVAHALRADQEEFAALAETRTARLAEFLTGASRDVAALNEAATLGARSMAQLIEAAAARSSELAAVSEAERTKFGDAAAHALTALVEAASREREALEGQMRATLEAMAQASAGAREAATAHAKAARSQVDQLHEAAFAAGQKAEEVFQARLGEARDLIERSARLVEDAAAVTATKLDEGLEQSRAALAELGAMVANVRTAAAGLPAEAEARIGEIREAIDKGMAAMLAAAQRTAQETQAIDQGFQERVRRNYEMLSEAVQLMGVVAHAGQASTLRRPGAAPAPRAEPAAPLPADAAPTPEPVAVKPPAVAPAPPPAPAADLRPRLKFTAPDETPYVPSAPAPAPAPVARAPVASQPAHGQGEAGRSDLSWKALLATGGADSDEAMGSALFRDITQLGIDPAALLTRRSVGEIAAAIQTGDFAGAREVVRNLAPAAVRRVSRRLLSDPEFGGRGRAFSHRFHGLLDEARARDRQGFEAAALLASDQGRAFLLLNSSGPDVAA